MSHIELFSGEFFLLIMAIAAILLGSFILWRVR